MEIHRKNEMSISFKKSSTKTSIKHNNRDFKEEDWNTKYHDHIDREKSKDNVYLIQKDIHEMYDQLFGEAVEEYNAKQKRNDRKIDNYFSHVNQSKTLNLQQEFIIQIGDIDDFKSEEGLNTDSQSKKKITNEILKEYVRDFEQRNPNLKIYNAAIHNDEASPHLHMNVIPVATGYKRGVNKQPSFHKAIKQQGIDVEKDKDAFKIFRDREVKEIEHLMNERGLERKYIGTNHVRDVNEYKQVMSEVATLQLKAMKLEKEIKEKQLEAKKIETSKNIMKSQVDTLLSVKNEIEHHKQWRSYSDELKIEVAKEYFPNPLNKADKLEKANKILKLKEYAEGKNTLNLLSNEFLTDSLECIQQTVEENSQQKIEPYKEEIKKLKAENQTLREENQSLKYSNHYLSQQLTILKQAINRTIHHVIIDIKDELYKGLGYFMSQYKLPRKHCPLPVNDNEELDYYVKGISTYEKEKQTQKRMISRGQDLEL